MSSPNSYLWGCNNWAHPDREMAQEDVQVLVVKCVRVLISAPYTV